MRLLLTGGLGFIGSAVVRAAAAEGWDVTVLDAAVLDAVVPASVPGSLPDGVTAVRGDAGDPAALERVLPGTDVVCHLAAKVGLELGIADAPAYVGANDLATAQLVAAMARHDVRGLVLASSMVVYGEGAYVHPADGRPVRPAPRRERDLAAGLFDPRDAHDGEVLLPALTTEDAPTDPRSVYALTKLAQEHLAAAWARSTGGTAIALRYHNVYGPGLPRDTPYAGVAALFASAVARGEAPLVFEDGRQRRSFVHVDDVAQATIAAIRAIAGSLVRVEGSLASVEGSLARGEGPRALLKASATPGPAIRVFNVGGPSVQTILDVAEAISAPAGIRPVVTGRYRAGDVRHITASSAAITAELGWRPRIGFADGMRSLAESLVSAGR
ncbi:NAD-dependent epimerase/dehydratase family protein [Sinomonas sp. P10A9]|uniref:NAD-dependent epimerase/dehydratase family protein n=1 Tax=Sinomonas puerhi TaxID=3238584 RepID=A0AB39L2L9_9MICC